MSIDETIDVYHVFLSSRIDQVILRFAQHSLYVNKSEDMKICNTLL